MFKFPYYTPSSFNAAIAALTAKGSTSPNRRRGFVIVLTDVNKSSPKHVRVVAGLVKLVHTSQNKRQWLITRDHHEATRFTAQDFAFLLKHCDVSGPDSWCWISASIVKIDRKYDSK